MIRIAVTAQQGVALDGRLAAEFDAAGGTIGRADTNLLTLSDPDRTVSRVHAQVLCRDGQFFLVDRGSNPLLCNGVPLGSGQEVALHGGERLTIGNFELSVEAVAGAALAAEAAAPMATPPAGDDDPFADLLAGLGPPAAAAPSPSPGRPSEAVPFPDPMGRNTRAESAAELDPFAGLDDFAVPARPASPAPAGLLDDFSDLGLPAAAAPGATGQRIDDLFGGSAGLGGDPLALSPLADPMLQPNTAATDDPLAALARAPAARTAAPSADHVPIGQFGYTPPRALTQPPATAAQDAPLFDDQTGQPIRIARAPAPTARPAAAPSPSPRAPAAPPANSDDPFAGLLEPGATTGGPLFDAPSTQAAPEPASPPPPPPPPPAPPVPPAPAARAQRPIAAPAAATVAAAAEPLAAAPPAGDQADLLAAFLRGLGPLHQTPTTLTPALMERIGVLLRSATEGTLQLLLTRQELKREVRAEVTMIAAQANNPLKFSPTVDVALTHLLGPGVRGFMPAEAAMRDAYDDLRSHQFGVMVGLRAALANLIERFGPDELEKKIAAKSALDSLFASGRKARLWDQFVALYGTIAAEAEDDFHTLFGKAFLEAYEAQMARLKDAAASAER